MACTLVVTPTLPALVIVRSSSGPLFTPINLTGSHRARDSPVLWKMSRYSGTMVGLLTHTCVSKESDKYGLENCPVPFNISGYSVVNNICALALSYGTIKSLKAYLGIAEQTFVPRAVALRSELQSSGVSLVDCPHNGRKDVADKMIIGLLLFRWGSKKHG